MFQLWKSDDYGQKSIVDKGASCQKLIDKAMALVTEQNLNTAINVQTALTDAQECVVLFFDQNGDQIHDMVYAGPTGPQGAHKYLMLNGDDVESSGKFSDVAGIVPKFYIGSMNPRKSAQKKYFATKFDVSRGSNGKKTLGKQKLQISSFKQMAGKTMYFVAKR